MKSNNSSQRPHVKPVDFDGIPQTMRNCARWVLWRYVPKGSDWTKVPFSSDGKPASSTDPQSWTTADHALATYRKGDFDGIGFVLGDGWAGIDFDDVVTDAGGLLPWASTLLSRFKTYAEISPSGGGVKIYLRGTFDGKGISPTRQAEGGMVEVYCRARFFCVTGDRWPDSLTTVEDCSVELTTLVDLVRKQRRADRTRRLSAENGNKPVNGTGCTTHYGQAALTSESDRVANAPQGSRNSILNEAAFSLGTLVGSGEVDRSEAIQALGSAGLKSGLSEVEVSDVIERGLRDGERSPRVPASKENASRSRSAVKTDDSSMADRLVDLALRQFRIGRTTANEPFAVRLNGPNIAMMFRGSNSFRATLARDYHREIGRTANASALADALTTIEGEALDASPEDLALRLAHLGDEIVIDLGRPDGRAIIVNSEGWRVVEESPVLFRRTALTAEMPLPDKGGSLDELRRLLNIAPADWLMLRGWLVAALFSNVAHPILLLGGLQGTGKSTALRILAELIDPSPAPLRSEPRDPEQWACAASSSWFVALDNVSAIPAWFSDTLCKSCTGDAFVRRKLYTDSDVTVSSFRRVVGMTSIDAGALRGDLADRLLLVELEKIADSQRRSESELLAAYQSAKPAIFGALLDDIAFVLRRLPTVQIGRLPRMADFARILAALDFRDPASDGLNVYLGQSLRLANDVVESDPVAVAVREFARSKGSWSGTASELMIAVTPSDPPRGWPGTPQIMGGRVKRLAPALEAVGVLVDTGRNPTSDRTRKIMFTWKG